MKTRKDNYVWSTFDSAGGYELLRTFGKERIIEFHDLNL